MPTARWVGAKSGPFVCIFQGYKYPFGEAELRRLYPTSAIYVAKVRQSAAALEAQGWLTAEDGAEIIRNAARSKVP